jgi:oligopeptide transport system substrate-binding protein
MRARRRARLLVGVAALSLVVTACGGDDGGGAGGATATGGRFSIQISEPQHALIPGHTAETSGAEVLDALFSGLVDYDVKTSEPSNKVAESITSSDNKVWTVKLKSGWKFHNDESVTAASFVDAWNYTAYAKNAQESAGFFSRVQGYDEVSAEKPTAEKMSGLKVVDDTTFTVTLKEPFSQFPVVVGYTAFYPLPKVFFDDPKKFGEAPVGNGPFKMNGTWVHKQVIKVDKWDAYPETKAKVDGIDFKVYASLDTAYNDLRAGNLDATDSLPSSALATAKQELGERYVEQPSSIEQYIGFPVFNKKYTADFRKAVSMAINREEIAKTIFSGTRVPAGGFVSPVVDGARENACGEFCTFDAAKAKTLLQTSGWSGPLTLAYNADGGHKEWIEAVANQLRQNLGLTVTVKPYAEFAKILDDLGAKKFDGAFRMGWSFDYPSIENYLSPIFGTQAIQIGSNYAGYSNPQFDDLVKKGDTAASKEEGITFYQQAEDLLYKEMPYLPMFFSKLTGAYSANVRNVTFDAFTRVDKVNVEVIKK